MEQNETLEEAVKTYYEENIDQSNIPREHYEWEIQDLMLGFAYKWQQEQDKKLYSEEEVDFFVKNILHHIKYYEYNVNNLELISFSNDIESEIEKLYEEFKNK